MGQRLALIYVYRCVYTIIKVMSLTAKAPTNTEESYFKAPLTTCKAQPTTSESAWAFFISRCRHADNEYLNECNISFAIQDLESVHFCTLL